jgi:hypothetical protein
MKTWTLTLNTDQHPTTLTGLTEDQAARMLRRVIAGRPAVEPVGLDARKDRLAA